MANNQRHVGGFAPAIVREANGRLAVFVNGQRADVLNRQTQAVAACLFDNLGRAVPYRRLIAAIGHKSDDLSNRHLLRQYISMLRQMLLASEAPYGIAVVQEVGYALCEIAKESGRAARNGSSNGVSQLAKNVRQLRTAAGLTQTALAKRSGLNRSHLNRLEGGGRKPTLDTLARLAKALRVAPGSFL
jgi:DNA-binding XRE family transcriptional regulator